MEVTHEIKPNCGYHLMSQITLAMVREELNFWYGKIDSEGISVT